MKKNILFLIIGILIGVIITSIVFYIYEETHKPKFEDFDEMRRMDRGPMGEDFRGDRGPMEESAPKTTTADDVDSGVTVTDKDIDLSKYSSNITIEEEGEYTLSGNFEYAVLVNSTDDVTLVLNGVDIKNNLTAAIANIGQGNLSIRLEENTENNLSDGGSSEYDACIYSNGALIIEGNGTLNVYGNQEEGEGIATETNDITINGGTINIECQDDGINAGGDGGLITINGGDIYIKANGDGIDSNKNLVINGGNVYTIGSPTGGDAGIDTDDGYEINGGTVIALGSDMLERPESSSKQKSVTYELKSKVSSGSAVSIQNSNGTEIVSFEAKEDFRTLIVSNDKVENGSYTLYVNGEKTENTATVK